MDNFTLTTKQEQAISMIKARYDLGMSYTSIAGYAGTGKSTIIKYAVDALGIPEEKVAYIAYTGKAANVLKNKGCPNATTAHKLLYYARQTKNGNYVFTPKKVLEENYELLVVDEVSMLPQELWYQLLSHGIHVIAAGDPGQLSPPKDETNTVLNNPHIFLDEILRQAQESAIIRLSMHVREGKDFRLFGSVSGEVKIVPHKYMFEDEDLAVLQADQIICGTNNHRFELNAKVRQLLGKGIAPEPDDKIIGLKNHWNDVSDEGNALTNGAIGSILPIKHIYQSYPSNARFQDFPDQTDILLADFITEDGDTFHNIPIDYQCLILNSPSLSGSQEYRLGGYNNSLRATCEKYNRLYNPKIIPYNFNFGYAITTWKSQGSQYNNVLGYDATWLKRQNPDEYKRYLYTLITRAVDRLILVGE